MQGKEHGLGVVSLMTFEACLSPPRPAAFGPIVEGHSFCGNDLLSCCAVIGSSTLCRVEEVMIVISELALH